VFKAQAEKILRDLDVVSREEFEAVKDMARLAREENDALRVRIEALEGKASGEKAAKSAKKAKDTETPGPGSLSLDG